MKFQETGRFGRITKALKANGFDKQMEEILFDSSSFPNLKKPLQTQYVEAVISRMEQKIGMLNTEKVLFDCGKKCCGKSWSTFAKNIYNNSISIKHFLENLNKEEEKYSTFITYNEENYTIYVQRTKCICGLINKGALFFRNSTFCKCSNGHMQEFFGSIFSVDNVTLLKSIYAGDEICKWEIELKKDKI